MAEQTNGEEGKDEGGISRRTFLKGVVAGAAAAGVLAAAPSVLAGSAEGSDGNDAELESGPVTGPIVVYIRDSTTGEVEIMSGTKAVVRKDAGLVSRLKAARVR